MDFDGAGIPEWRANLTARQLANYKVEIEALCETQLVEEDNSQTRVQTTFFWVGCSRYESHEAGVGFTMKSNLV